MSAFDFEAAEVGLPPFVNPKENGTSVLLVSAMFPLAKSKHTKKEYGIWLGRFLGAMTTDVYMYTTPDLADTIRSIRGKLPITIDTTYSSPFEVPPLQGLEEAYVKMNDMDDEKWHHSPGLYAVWNAKPFLLESAVHTLAKQGKTYDYAFWNDGGSFRRNHRYSHWPDPDRVEQVYEEASRLTHQKKEDLLFFPVFQLPDEKFKDWKETMGPIANSVQLSEGSFFGGSTSTIEWFAKIFYAYHDHYISRGLFVGIDQDLFNSLFLLFPERMFTVWMNDPIAPAHKGIIPSPSLIPSLERGYLGECGAEWFYYQFWLADQQTRDMMREIWVKEERWRKTGWWSERKLCRLTRAMSMSDFLKRAFSEDWKPPTRHVHIPDL
ncbi:hypothetical protein CVT24_006456 [Panaeolus cyanescens]|uniref:Uncharacterized protein n=1 Tax=Panaeolus cyanescens TaxID=181874 RepID=A0A409VZA3_9AGAR|nr:hypothetical protein CVT24_006456 [Panaeolus cyanescens]